MRAPPVSVFEKDAVKLEESQECDDTDQWGFSNMGVRKVSYKVPDSEKETKLKEIEEKLAKKYTPSVFRDILEGRTINMKPVDIVLQDNIPVHSGNRKRRVDIH